MPSSRTLAALAPAVSCVARICDSDSVTVLATPVSQPVSATATSLTGHSVLGWRITARRLRRHRCRAPRPRDRLDPRQRAGGHRDRAAARARRRVGSRTALWSPRSESGRYARADHARERARASTFNRNPFLALASAHRAGYDVLRRPGAALGAREPLRPAADLAPAARHHDLVPPVGDGGRQLERERRDRGALRAARGAAPAAADPLPRQRHHVAGAPLSASDVVRRRTSSGDAHGPRCRAYARAVLVLARG